MSGLANLTRAAAGGSPLRTAAVAAGGGGRQRSADAQDGVFSDVLGQAQAAGPQDTPAAGGGPVMPLDPVARQMVRWLAAASVPGEMAEPVVTGEDEEPDAAETSDSATLPGAGRDAGKATDVNPTAPAPVSNLSTAAQWAAPVSALKAPVPDACQAQAASPAEAARDQPAPGQVAAAGPRPHSLDGPGQLALPPASEREPAQHAVTPTQPAARAQQEMDAPEDAASALTADRVVSARVEQHTGPAAVHLSAAAQIASAIVNDSGSSEDAATAAPIQRPAAPVIAGTAKVLALTLRPDNLGVVTVRMHTSGENLRLNLTVPTHAVAADVQRDVDVLTRALQQAGLTLESVSIQVANDRAQDGYEAGRGGDGAAAGRSGNGSPAGDGFRHGGNGNPASQGGGGSGGEERPPPAAAGWAQSEPGQRDGAAVDITRRARRSALYV